MDLNDYLKKASETAVYPNIRNNWQYTLIGLTGELGELANILKKVIRDHNGVPTIEHYKKIEDELGDIFWYLTMLCYEFHFDPNGVLENNIQKLNSRKLSNTVHDRGNRNESN